VPARRSKTSLAERSPRKRIASGSEASADSSASWRHSHGGTSASETARRFAGTPRLRKYFCASTSQATCDHCAGTSMSRASNTTEPSGLRISEFVVVNAMAA